MTKFILHGGVDKNKRDQFFELTKDFFAAGVEGRKSAKILIIYFARDERKDDTDAAFSFDTQCFQKAAPETNIEFAKASRESEKFRQQVIWADVVYAVGGDSILLLEQILKTPEFGQLIQNKVYMGSSAGANLVGKYFYSKKRDLVSAGLGILPIKVLPHWAETRQEALTKLQAAGEDLPILKIPEYKFEILEQ